MKDLQAEVTAWWDRRARAGLARRGTLYLEDVPEGERFILGERSGIVLRHGPSGVMVRYDGKTEVEINGKKFSRPLAPVQLAGQTEVRRV
jgi:hypothetical protein